MKMQIILLYAGQYSIVDESSGEVKQGVTCNYYFNTDLRAEDNKNGTKGTRPAKGSIDFLLMKKIKSAPALYEADFEMQIGSDGKPVLKIQDLDYISDIFIGVVSSGASGSSGAPGAPDAPDSSKTPQAVPEASADPAPDSSMEAPAVAESGSASVPGRSGKK